MSYRREIILNKIQELTFKRFGKFPESIVDLKADASDREIYRLFVDGHYFIGIYNENENENIAFINFTKTFSELGFNVPEIIDVADDNLFYLEEDLGDITLFKHISQSQNADHIKYYKRSLYDLIRFQTESGDKINFDFCYQTKEFNAEVIESDLQKFNDYYVRSVSGNDLEKYFFQDIIDHSRNILKNVRSDFFLYRDFQPRNIMVKDHKLYYLDYQSGRKGPLQYDVASFLYSGSINITDAERDVLLKYYLEELKKHSDIDEEEFTPSFYFFVFIRLLQMLGSYSYLNKTRNDTDILKKIPKAILNLGKINEKIDDKKLNDFISNIITSNP